VSYIGLDVGTSGCKAAVMDGRGVRAIARSEYPLRMERPGWAELDMALVWKAAKRALLEIAPFARDASGMAVSSLGESFVLLDGRDRPLAGGMTYLDERGEDELEDIARAFSPQALHALTGAQPSAMYSLPKLLWIRKNLPEAAARAKKLMLVSEYAGYLLTGERAIDCSLASRTMMLDVRALDWSDEVLDRFDIPRGLLAPVVPAGRPVGRVRGEIARALGLPEGLTLYAGCHDQCAATLGAGVFEKGGVMAGEGSSESLIVLAGRGEIDASADLMADRALSFEPFVLPGLYAVTLGQPTYGTCFRWFAEKFSDGATPAQLDAACAEDAGSALFLPYLAQNPMDRGTGAQGAFLGLTLGTSKAQMYRALHEGLCMETRVNCDLLAALGAAPARLVATGGCSRSALHMQIKADVLGMPVDAAASGDAGIVGLAMVCAVASGEFSGYEKAAAAMVPKGVTYLPRRRCDEKLTRYRRARAAVRAIDGGGAP